jgi:nucleotide-binding universal stress UspA family protein
MYFKKVLCPVDFSDDSKKALRIALEIKKQFNAQLDVVNVVIDPFGDYVHPTKARYVESSKQWAIEDAKQDLKKLKDEMFSDEESVGLHVLFGIPAEEILSFTKEQGHDLIIIGTHGRRGIARLVIGSVTEEVIRKAPCPVLSVRLSK